METCADVGGGVVEDAPLHSGELRHLIGGDTRVYEPQIRARLGTTAFFCKVVVLKSKDLLGGERPAEGGVAAALQVLECP